MPQSISALRNIRVEPKTNPEIDQDIEVYTLFLDSGAELSFITKAFNTATPDAIANALGAVARARGISHVARRAGVARETLYRALRDGGDPKLSTFLGVISALGFKLTINDK